MGPFEQIMQVFGKHPPTEHQAGQAMTSIRLPLAQAHISLATLTEAERLIQWQAKEIERLKQFEPPAVAVPDEDAAATKGLRKGWQWAKREVPLAQAAVAVRDTLEMAKEAMMDVANGSPVFGESVRRALKAIDAALQAAPPAPAGFALVPMQPTNKQIVLMAGAILQQEKGTADSRHPYWARAVEQAEDAYSAAIENAPPAQTSENLRCKSVQKRLATMWGYVPAQEDARDAVLSEIICEMDELLKNGALPYSLESLLVAARAAQGGA